MDKRGGYHDFPSKVFWARSAENFRGAIYQCFISCGYRNMLHVRDKRRGDSRFSVKNFLSYSAENFRRNPLVFH